MARRPRARCAASHSCYTFRSVDDEKVNVDEKNVDVVLFFDGYDARSRLGLARLTRARCAAPPSCYTVRSVDDEKVNVEKKHVDFVLFLMGRTRGPA